MGSGQWAVCCPVAENWQRGGATPPAGRHLGFRSAAEYHRLRWQTCQCSPHTPCAHRGCWLLGIPSTCPHTECADYVQSLEYRLLMAITLTEAAAGEIKRYMEAQKVEPGAVLRMGVAGGGCSGLQYTLGFETNFDPAGRRPIRATRRGGCHHEEDGAAPGRDDDRFSRRSDGPGVLDRQSERAPRGRLSRLRTSLEL